MNNLATLLLVIGITCLIFGLRNLFSYLLFQYRAKARQAWVETSGRVTDREIQPEEVRSPREGTITRYYINVQYTYSVQGNKYSGDFNLKTAYKSKEEVDEALEAYPNGTRLAVRYDPRRPQKHINDREESGPAPKLLPGLLLLAGGLASVSLGIVLTN